MDVNDWRSLVTAVGFVLFLALFAWTWSSKRRAAHDAAAQLPFADTEQQAGPEHAAPVKDIAIAGGRRE